MTSEHPLTDLRDIHLPAGSVDFSGRMFAPEPFVVLMVLMLLTMSIAKWRRGRWVRTARARLKTFEGSLADVSSSIESSERHWRDLVGFATEVGQNTNAAALPDQVFMPPAQAGQPEQEIVLQYLRIALGAGR